MLWKSYITLLFILFSHGNIFWGSIEKSKLNELHTLRKRVVCIISYAPRGSHSRPYMLSNKILNVYEINLYQVLSFMFKVYKKKDCIQSHFKRVAHKYPTRHSQFAFYSQQYETCKYNKCKISKGGPLLWNSFKNLSLDLIN